MRVCAENSIQPGRVNFVSRCEKRGKKILKIRKFCVVVQSELIEFCPD